MSSLYTNGPAKRLLCSACRQSSRAQVIFTLLTGSFLICKTEARRQYATKRINPHARTAGPPPRLTTPTSLPASAPPRVSRPSYRDAGLSKGAPARFIFSSEDVPPLKEWVNSLESLGNKDLTALQCVEGAQSYVSVATQHESQWRHKLDKEYNLSPYLLHWIGILLISGNTATRWRLGTHMLRSASELGYMPSTLSLVRIFESMPSHMSGKYANTIMYREANARFQEAVKAVTDPDALTLQGIIHARREERGSNMKALAAFSQAIQAWKKKKCETEDVGKGEQSDAASVAAYKRATSTEAVGASGSRDFHLPPPREPRWEWEVSCILGQAKILAKSPSRINQALGLFKVAALELDNPHAFFMVAKLMDGPRDSPERRAYLLKAAISGEAEACHEMGQLEALAATRNDLTQKERTEHKMLSKEWYRLAEGEDLSPSIKAEGDGN